MTNSEQAIREIAEKHFPCVGTRNDREYRKMEQDALVSSITSLISEHYVSREEYDEEKKSNSLLHKAMVTAEKGGHDKAMEEISEHYYPKEKYDELLQQRDELKEALIEAVKTIRIWHGFMEAPPTEMKAWEYYQQSPEMKKINAAIKNTETK